jgi:glutamate/tyrosine decarboxylase-like PLP-dependent enzyme
MDTSEWQSGVDLIAQLAKERGATLHDAPTIASLDDIDAALTGLPSELNHAGLGLEATLKLLLDTVSRVSVLLETHQNVRQVVPALSPGHSGPRYFGFVTGGTLPVALLADFLVSLFDTNAQVNLPTETIATYIEYLALKGTLELLRLSPDVWQGRTITTGATAANVLGLSLGREHVVVRLKARAGVPDYSVADQGCDVPLRIYTAGAHASILKAASILGLGRHNVIELVDERRRDSLVSFDLVALEAALEDCQQKGRGAILVASIGEVNSGSSTANIPQIRALCVSHPIHWSALS